MIRRATSSKRVLALKEGLLGRASSSSSVASSSFASTSSQHIINRSTKRGISSFSKNNSHNNAVKEVKKATGKDSRSQRGIAGARKDASHSSLDATSAKKKVVAKINGGNKHLDIARRGKAAMPQAATSAKPNAIDYSVGGTVYPVCLLYTSPSPRDVEESRMPSSA